MPFCAANRLMTPNSGIAGSAFTPNADLLNYVRGCIANPANCSALWWQAFQQGMVGFGLPFIGVTLIAIGIWYWVMRRRQDKGVPPSA